MQVRLRDDRALLHAEVFLSNLMYGIAKLDCLCDLHRAAISRRVSFRQTPTACILDPVTSVVPRVSWKMDHLATGREIIMVVVPVDGQTSHMQNAK